MEKLYPIGTVVKFNENPLEYTITGYFPQNKETGEVFTYMAVNASFGITTGPGAILFNAEQIGKVIFEGYRDEKADQFLEKLEKVPAILANSDHAGTGE
ncbi:DUF4176 domain-containing protein [Blautia sp. HCP3S3_H10_1]|uniref:DUF4176 domain-containing protein n=1 Tax=unclassified Blautia TaxID=2648079 RepID=UPI003F90EA40|nr:DUF4176 domain-containing protein [Clostridia bacterium]